MFYLLTYFGTVNSPQEKKKKNSLVTPSIPVNWVFQTIMFHSHTLYLHLGQGNPKYKYRLGRECIQSSPEEKDT